MCVQFEAFGLVSISLETTNFLSTAEPQCTVGVSSFADFAALRIHLISSSAFGRLGTPCLELKLCFERICTDLGAIDSAKHCSREQRDKTYADENSNEGGLKVRSQPIVCKGRCAREPVGHQYILRLNGSVQSLLQVSVVSSGTLTQSLR